MFQEKWDPTIHTTTAVFKAARSHQKPNYHTIAEYNSGNHILGYSITLCETNNKIQNTQLILAQMLESGHQAHIRNSTILLTLHQLYKESSQETYATKYIKRICRLKYLLSIVGLSICREKLHQCKFFTCDWDLFSKLRNY